MNFFFGINNQIFKSEIQIPLFKNTSPQPAQLNLFKSFPKNNKWIIEEIKNENIDNHFYILKNENISDNEIYFLAEKEILDNYDSSKLKNFSDFTTTLPAFRANLKIYIEDGGFSSFQSEYPFSMAQKKGTILSSFSSLVNIDADKNFIIIKNILEEPIEKIFHAYLINYETKKVEKKYKLLTNFTNCIEIENEHIKPSIFLVTENYLAVPMYISIKDKYLSLEHTHPPHEYIVSKNKFLKTTFLKNEINKIIS